MLLVDIHKRYDTFSLRFQHRFDKPCIGIFGPSGAGKSTLLHLIAGLSQPDEGKIVLNNHVLFDAHRDLPTAKRNIGYVRQESLLFPHLSIQENLLFAQKYGHKQSNYSFDMLVETLSLSSFLSRKPHTLSGGEKQRVALARALLATPKYLLLDEPMASLDDESSNTILSFLLECKHHTPLIYVSHHAKRMNALADEIIVLQTGNILNIHSDGMIETQ